MSLTSDAPAVRALDDELNRQDVRVQLQAKSAETAALLREQAAQKEREQDARRRHDKAAASRGSSALVTSSASELGVSERASIDTDRRLGRAVAELRSLVVYCKMVPDLHEDEELLRAEEALEQASV
ncbi:hypothetical protein BC834DRAFT_839930 [Gloeopeniophorella convolvens]|nr:hypothetical protein BC834DRAFT_839930 [Gloeopeniophorella convolvens]